MMHTFCFLILLLFFQLLDVNLEQVHKHCGQIGGMHALPGNPGFLRPWPVASVPVIEYRLLAVAVILPAEKGHTSQVGLSFIVTFLSAVESSDCAW